MGAWHALDVNPHDEDDDQRRADVNEGEQGEQSTVDAFEIEEVANQGAVEHWQYVKPLGRGDDNELRQFVPYQHEAVDAGDVDQPDQGDTGKPREGAETAIAIVGKVPQQVQDHGQDHAVGGVTVNAAHDAASPPLIVGDAFDRLVCVVDSGLGKDVEIEPGPYQQPELPETDRAEVVEGVQFVAEGHIEYVLNAHEEPANDLLEKFDHGLCPLRRVGRDESGWVLSERAIYLKKSPPLSGLKSITMTWAGLSVTCSSLTKLKPGLTRLSFILTTT